jgi:hypothetical protein
VAAGFKDVARIEQEALFEQLRGEPAFLELLSGLRTAGRSESSANG